jgi:hypothetical protein
MLCVLCCLPVVPEANTPCHFLDNVQHLLRLAEHKRLVTLYSVNKRTGKEVKRDVRHVCMVDRELGVQEKDDPERSQEVCGKGTWVNAH